jgi:hypothetical protein
MKRLDITSINPWWLRLIALLVLGIPAFSGWPLDNITQRMAVILPSDMAKAGDIFGVASWVLYSCIIWIVVTSSVGPRKSLEYLAASFIIGITTAILGSVMRKAIPFIAGSLSGDEISLKMLNLLLVIVTVVPYFLLFMNSFSAKNLISKLADTTGKRKTLGLHFALFLRVIQHTGEVIFNLVEIWAEEHPDKIFPRHRRDWGAKWYSTANIFPWAGSAVFAWVFATMIHTFEPIPSMVDDVEKINQSRRYNDD